MHHRISCPRCGSEKAMSPNTSCEWDEIHCSDCGEFLETRQAFDERHTHSFLIETCLKSRAMAREMGIRA